MHLAYLLYVGQIYWKSLLLQHIQKQTQYFYDMSLYKNYLYPAMHRYGACFLSLMGSFIYS